MIVGKGGLRRRGTEVFLLKKSQNRCSRLQSGKRSPINIFNSFEEHPAPAPTYFSAGGDTGNSSTRKCRAALDFNKCNQAVV